MVYYLKKCGFQELGSVDRDGKAHRGRYLLTSMNKDILEMFPPLSIAQLNDAALLPIIPLYSGKKVYCNFVYHNDKFHGSTAVHPRNEYRLYLNKELENSMLLFSTDDIMILRKETINDDEVGQQNIYYMDLIKNEGTSLYRELNSIINDYPIKGGYGLHNGVIPEFEKKVEKIKKQGETKIVVDDSVTRRVAHTNDSSLAALFNASTFRDFVMVGYNNLCAITGTVIKYDTYMNLEAAHIKPRSHGGLFLPNNGIALCRDLHWAFDKGFFTLNNNYEVIVHPKTTSDYLRTFDGKQVRLPNDPFFRPDFNNIHYHNDSVYGLFLTTGRL